MRLMGDISINPAWKIQVETKTFSHSNTQRRKEMFSKMILHTSFHSFFPSFSLQPDRVRSGELFSNFSPTLLLDWASSDDFEQMQQKIPISEMWEQKERKKESKQRVMSYVRNLGRKPSKSSVAAISVCRTVSCFCIFQSRNELFLFSGHHFRWEEQTETGLCVHELSYH